MIEYLILALAIGLGIGLAWSILKKVASWASVALLNSIAGVLILLFFNTYFNWSIPISIPTLIVCALFGIPGVGALLVLDFFGAI
jgi:pro-sigmaK processing inhibitor BofA